MSVPSGLPLVEPMEPWQILRLMNIAKWGNAMSVAGAALVVITFAVFKEKRNGVGGWCIFGFSLSSMLLSLTLLLPTFVPPRTAMLFNGDAWCKIQGMGIQLFGFGCIISWALFAFNFYFMLSTDVSSDMLMSPFKRRQFIAGVIFSSALAIIPLAANRYQYHFLFCWFPMGDWGWVFGAFLGEMFLFLLAGLYAWIRIVMEIRRRRKRAQQYILQRQSSQAAAAKGATIPWYNYMRHVLFILFFMGCFTMFFSNEVYMWVHGVEKLDYNIWFADIIALSSTGVMTFLLFGATGANFALWKQLILSALGRGERSTDQYPLLNK